MSVVIPLHVRDGEEAVSGGAFRKALRRHPVGVAVVTTVGKEHAPAGLTLTSLRAASFSPPLLTFVLAHAASTWASFSWHDRFLVHLLGGDQAELADRFATSGIDRFAPPTAWEPDEDGLPLLEDVPVAISCRQVGRARLADHDLIVGCVTGVRYGTERPPLLHHEGSYRARLDVLTTREGAADGRR